MYTDTDLLTLTEQAQRAYKLGQQAGRRLHNSVEENRRALVGRRIRMTGLMTDDPHPLAVGEEGTVRSVDEGDDPLKVMVNVKWDSGRTLRLFLFDPFEIIDLGPGVIIERIRDRRHFEIVEVSETSFVAQGPKPEQEKWQGKIASLIPGMTYEIVNR